MVTSDVAGENDAAVVVVDDVVDCAESIVMLCLEDDCW